MGAESKIGDLERGNWLENLSGEAVKALEGALEGEGMGSHGPDGQQRGCHSDPVKCSSCWWWVKAWLGVCELSKSRLDFVWHL